MKFLKLVFLVFISLQCYSQSKFKGTKYYVLPDFAPGEIVMNDGTKKQGLFNYNSYTENIDFLKDGEIFTFTAADKNRINSVVIGDRTFFKKGNKIYEILLESKVRLYVDYDCKLTSKARSDGGYGSTSQTGSSVSATSVYRDGLTYFIEEPHLYNVNITVEYWIKKDGELQNFKTLGQLKRIYKKRKKEIKAYKKINDIDLDEPNTIKKLIGQLEDLN